MLRKVSLLLSALLLCLRGGGAQDIMSPNLNFIEELEKIKNIEERLKIQDITVNLLSSSVEELKQENAALKTKVKTLQKENEAKKVAFSASLLAFGTGQTGPYESVQSPLIYKKVYTNYGNGYNSDTGIFTAPLNGVYYFRFYAHCHTGNKMAVSLYKNDLVQCSVFSERPITNGNAGNGIVLTLNEGDRIYTKLWDNSWVYDDHESYTSFGGFLLFPL